MIVVLALWVVGFGLALRYGSHDAYCPCSECRTPITPIPSGDAP